MLGTLLNTKSLVLHFSSCMQLLNGVWCRWMFSFHLITESRVLHYPSLRSLLSIVEGGEHWCFPTNLPGLPSPKWLMRSETCDVGWWSRLAFHTVTFTWMTIEVIVVIFKILLCIFPLFGSSCCCHRFPKLTFSLTVVLGSLGTSLMSFLFFFCNFCAMFALFFESRGKVVQRSLVRVRVSLNSYK